MPNVIIEVPPMVAMVKELEAKIRADRNLQPTDQVKVAMTVAAGLTKPFADLITEALEFNGKSASGNGANFVRKDYSNQDREPVDFEAIIQELVNFRPDIVIPVGNVDAIKEIAKPLEVNWPYLYPRAEFLATSEAVIPTRTLSSRATRISVSVSVGSTTADTNRDRTTTRTSSATTPCSHTRPGPRLSIRTMPCTPLPMRRLQRGVSQS